MTLQPGTRIGPYEIVAAIGAGGMGEVYRAHDTRLKRDVAVKVLPASVAGDPERRARLEREAQAVAALSHPNVLAIFDTGMHGEQLYIVMELLEGETLHDRLVGGPLTPRKAIDVAIQIARGLAAAHDKQIVHRDLKPGNVFLVSDGHVKILDFGLARRALSPEGETVAPVTDPGTVLGTVGYMAPEQVRDEPIDARADLFAFGAVLYEMLTGRRAFRRDTAAETMTAILREEPPELLQVRPELPPALDRIVRHCLEKNPSERFQTARDVAFALDALSGSGTTSLGVPAARPVAAGRSRRLLPWLAGGALAAGGMIAAWVLAQAGGFGADRPDDGPLVIGAAKHVTTEEGLEIDPALSPDGRHLAYAAGPVLRMRVYIRAVAGGRTIPISEGDAPLEFQPRWSPDGSQLLYLSGDTLRVAPGFGGATRAIASDVSAAAWAPGGREILVVRGRDLSVTSLDGGAERPLRRAPSSVYSCDWSARGNRIACAFGNRSGVVPGGSFGNVAPSGIVVMPAEGETSVEVVERAGLNQGPVWSPDGRDLYFVSNRQGTMDVYAVAIAPDGRVEGEPRRVTTGLGAMSIALSAEGRHLAYATYAMRANIWTLPIPQGAPVDASTAEPFTRGNQVVEAMRVSRDGRWLLYDSTLEGNADIYRIPIGGGASEQLTRDPADDFAPDLSPDGRLIVFQSFRLGTRDVFVQPVGGGAAQAVAATDGQENYPVWSPDGSAIAFVDQPARKLALVRRSPTGEWGPPADLRPIGSRPSWLDERTLVYSISGGIETLSVDGGPPQVVYTPAPNSTDPPALHALPSEDGRTVYFISRDEEGRASLWSIPAAGGTPRPLVRFSDLSRPSIRAEFAAGAGRFFFRLEERQGDIVVAEVARRAR